MMRSFRVTLADGAVSYNLLTLLLATTGAVPTDGYFPNPCAVLDINTVSGTFTIADENGYGPSGQDEFHRSMDRNTIDLGQYYLQGSADGVVVEVSIEAT